MAEAKRPWNPWTMYDLSAEEMRAVSERAKRRQELKAEWLRKSTNPYKSISGPGNFTVSIILLILKLFCDPKCSD